MTLLHYEHILIDKNSTIVVVHVPCIREKKYLIKPLVFTFHFILPLQLTACPVTV